VYSFNQAIASHSFVSFKILLYAGILIVGLNTTFSHFFNVYNEISLNVWSWTCGLKSWTPIGPHVCEPWR